MNGCPSYYATYCSPVLLTPKLAKEIGVPRALILKQLQYWLYKPKHNYSKLIAECHDIDGHIVKNHRWIKDSYSTLARQISCLGLRTIKRSLKWLKEHGFIFIFNQKTAKKTYGINWYTINYHKVNELFIKSKYTPDIIQNNKQDGGKYASDSVQNAYKDMKKQNQQLLKALKDAQANVKKLRQARTGGVQARGSVTETPPSDRTAQGVVTERHNPSDRTAQARSDKMSQPTIESESYYEINNENKGARKSEISSAPQNQLTNNPSFTDQSYSKIEQAYADTFGGNLSIKGLNRIHQWLPEWDADLIIIVLHVTATRIDATNDRRVLGYAYSILQACSRKGVHTGKAWHARKKQALENREAKYRKQYSGKNDGGTPDDMRNQTFYQQMCRRVARKRTNKIFPSITDGDKQRGDIVVKACNIVMKAKNIPRRSVDYDKLIANDCAVARSLVTNQIGV